MGFHQPMRGFVEMAAHVGCRDCGASACAQLHSMDDLSRAVGLTGFVRAEGDQYFRCPGCHQRFVEEMEHVTPVDFLWSATKDGYLVVFRNTRRQVTTRTDPEMNDPECVDVYVEGRLIAFNVRDTEGEIRRVAEYWIRERYRRQRIGS